MYVQCLQKVFAPPTFFTITKKLFIAGWVMKLAQTFKNIYEENTQIFRFLDKTMNNLETVFKNKESIRNNLLFIIIQVRLLYKQYIFYHYMFCNILKTAAFSRIFY